MWKRFITFLIILTALAGGFFYFRYQVYFAHGRNPENQTFEVIKGEGNGQIAIKLEQAGLVSGNWYFYYYLQIHGLVNKILPGKYTLNGDMGIPEIAVHITSAENILPGHVRITIPEGWTSKKIAERLTANGLDGKGFLEIVQNPQEISSGYGFLDGAATLEGYLFPDTYFLKKDITAGGVVEKMLDNFDK
ncbi:MAG: endolytic transglycosylase MltG, partial [bacterium]|nr:endolytic transglycosylase MltG [bacterium]